VRTEITSGLKAGQEVVLADLTEALPTNSTDGRGSFERINGNVGGPPVTFSGGGPPGK